MKEEYKRDVPGEGACPHAPGNASRPREGACPHAPGNPSRPREGACPHAPERKHPSYNSVREQGFRSTILFVTVCTEGRNPTLANDCMLKIIVDAWERAQNWRVGRYVIMPDHIHFFCAPMSYPASDFHKWMKYWKRLTQQAFAARGDTRPPVCAAREDTRPPVVKLWQNGCWDTQMRTRDQYEGKWLYVRNNPVRKGLVITPDDWHYQGVLHDLVWHD